MYLFVSFDKHIADFNVISHVQKEPYRPCKFNASMAIVRFGDLNSIVFARILWNRNTIVPVERSVYQIRIARGSQEIGQYGHHDFQKHHEKHHNQDQESKFR